MNCSLAIHTSFFMKYLFRFLGFLLFTCLFFFLLIYIHSSYILDASSLNSMYCNKSLSCSVSHHLVFFRFTLMVNVLCTLFRNFLSTWSHGGVMLPSRSVIIFLLTLGSIIHLKLIFVYDARYGSKLVSFHINIHST